MKIKDFRITGKYPVLAVETEISEESASSDDSVTFNLGPWEYVSLLGAADLKSLVHLVYQNQDAKPTKAMQELKGQSLKNASQSALP